MEVTEREWGLVSTDSMDSTSNFTMKIKPAQTDIDCFLSVAQIQSLFLLKLLS